MAQIAADFEKPLLTRPRSYAGIVLGKTMARVGAKIGMAWVLIVAFCAVFGPFVANSHPFVMRTTDPGPPGLSFPLFRFLTWVDVTLLVVTGIGLALWLMRRWSAGRRWAIFGVLTILTGVTCALTVHPPQRQVFEEHRQMEARGQIAWAVYAPIPYSPRDRLRDQQGTRYQEPAFANGHYFGTDTNGADVLSRMIHAGRIALAVGFIATGIAVFIGVIVGGLMGYFSGIVDLVGMRIVEIFAAIPTLFLLLTLVAVIPPQWNPYRMYLVMVVIGLTGWVGYARFTRAEFLKLRQQDFVQAAKAAGLPLRSILFRHMLPNGVAPVLVEASFGVASAILLESVLSFLGLGLIEEPSWGQMLKQATSATGSFIWWMAVFPGLAIFLTVFAYNLVGESLRDAIDPYVSRD